MTRSKEVDKDFFTPRDYQIELLARAIDHNSIITLGTGTGKTFIAVLLLKEFSLKFLFDNKKAFFVVNCVPLVDQQADHIECHTPLRVGRVHGVLNSDLSYFESYVDKFDVIVITAQVLLDALNHACFKMSRVALLIFDECHHAIGARHPYRLLANEYRRVDQEMRPRILGLTASIINKKIKPTQLEQKMFELEQVLDSSIEAANDVLTVSKYGARPDELLVKCEEGKEFWYSCVFEFLDHLKNHVDMTRSFNPDFDLDPRKPIAEAINRTAYILEHLGPWCAWKVSGIWQKKFKKFAQDEMNQEKQKNLLLAAETTFRLIAGILFKQIGTISSLVELEPFISRRARRLLEILEVYRPDVIGIEQAKNGGNLCGIVFVEQRYTAYILNTLIKQVVKWEPEKFGFIKCDFVVGHSGTLADSGETQAAHRRQEKVLSAFRNSSLNLLIATNVLEEGVDVRQCNAVIRFNKPIDFRSYIQSRGRARKENATYYILVEGDEEMSKMEEDLKNYCQVEEMMLKKYKSLCDVDNEIVDVSVDERYPAYVVESTGAKCLMSNAISLVNRYCAKLPSDIFTRLVPQINPMRIEFVDGSIKWNAELILPINSPVKEIISLKHPVPRKCEALMAVAQEAIQRLHLRKELNDNLLPVGKDTIANLLMELDEEEFGPNIPTKAGSAKKRRLYERKLTKSLNKIFPGAGELYYIYVIEMNLTRPITEEGNPKKRRIINPADVSTALGFFSDKKLPPIPGFPVFMRQGMVKVKIKLAASHFVLVPSMMELVKKFHQHIFEDVLHLDPNLHQIQFLIDHAPVSLLIAPFKKILDSTGNIVDYELDMSCLPEHIRDAPEIPSPEKRSKFKSNEADFYDRVVTPWYREGPQAFYYVAEICSNLHPASDFPDDKYKTFNEYFKEKYDIEIFDQNQPLLDVDHTSSRMNLLLPRQVSTKNAKRFQDPAQRQILIPELVHIHPLSASLWHMLIALPTILYRVNALLLADELRATVLKEALGMMITLPEGFKWDMLLYPTAYSSDKSTTQIKNLEQLKKANALELESEQRNEVISEVDEASDDQNVFEVGVWDPSLAVDFIPVPKTTSSTTDLIDGEEKDEALAESIGGLGNQTLVSAASISDEDEEDEEEMFFDFNYKKDRIEQLPTRQLEPMGWGDENLNESAPISAPLTNSALPIDLLNVTGNNRFIFNTTTLMKDIQNQLNSSVEPMSENMTNDQKTPSQKLTPKRIFLDSYQALDDSENRRLKPVEEVIDLVEEQKRINESFGVDEDDIDVDEQNDGNGHSNNRNRKRVSTDHRVSFPNKKLRVERIETREKDLSSKIIKLPSRSPSELLPKITAPEIALKFSFDEDLVQKNPYGVSPSLLLQALTTSNASDGINLERLETVGDSFLKLSATNYLYHNHIDQHEGKLSFARSKEVSNFHLYKLGRRKGIPSIMEASKFDPHVSWLPPGFVTLNEFTGLNLLDDDEGINEPDATTTETNSMFKKEEITGWDEPENATNKNYKMEDGVETIILEQQKNVKGDSDLAPLPYNMMTQQYVSDKSIADCVEALIGAHLISLGPKPTLKVMKWLGLKVITEDIDLLKNPPLLKFIETVPGKAESELMNLYYGNSLYKIEEIIGYHFKDKAYLVQAFTHASYYKNRVTGCYQRLEFLGDAVLDYLITRYLFEHNKQYSPGVLTDLRSALVNNTIFASLAVKYKFHEHFIHLCPSLYHMISKYKKLCEEKKILVGANFNDEMYMLNNEEDIDEGQEEDVEVPKALGDIYEAIAGAVYLDCEMHLDIVWRIFYNLMKDTIEYCCLNPPQSPVRELFEFKNYSVRFTKLERILETSKIRVTVDINNGTWRFTGMGRSYRIAKSSAAKRALKFLKDLEKEKAARVPKK